MPIQEESRLPRRHCGGTSSTRGRGARSHTRTNHSRTRHNADRTEQRHIKFNEPRGVVIVGCLESNNRGLVRTVGRRRRGAGRGRPGARLPPDERRLSEHATDFQHSGTADRPQLVARADGRQPSPCYCVPHDCKMVGGVGCPHCRRRVNSPASRRRQPGSAGPRSISKVMQKSVATHVITRLYPTRQMTRPARHAQSTGDVAHLSLRRPTKFCCQWAGVKSSTSP